MKTITVVVALLLMTSVGQAQSLTTAQAKGHEGENATVCGVVASERTATSSRVSQPLSIWIPPTQSKCSLSWFGETTGTRLVSYRTLVHTSVPKV
jgi:hypothetical protein